MNENVAGLKSEAADNLFMSETIVVSLRRNFSSNKAEVLTLY